ncbi:MAG: Holliday junction branch migration protein RuvA [Bacillota bacterium]
MISFLRGKLVRAAAGVAVIEAGGIGYRINIPVSLAARLPQTGAECVLHTHFILREERAELYGFEFEKERDLFLLLLAVSGVGPKAALALLACLSPSEIERAVAEGDEAALQRVPGIGRKTAQRLLLELKDKLGGKESFAQGPVTDAVEALVALGYRRAEAQEAVRRAAGGEGADDLETVLRASLALLLKRGDKSGQ